MNGLKGACIIGQSGGPSSAINASAYGAIRAALDSPCITRVLGALHGIKGVLEDDLIDLGLEDEEELAYLKNTPSSELGSCRYKLKDPEEDASDYARILEIFRKYDVRYFFYNGGNDSMDTIAKISRYMREKGYECRCMGIPKTIDNDLYGTDHTPGFGSAAKYIATSFMEIWHDAFVYDTPMIAVVECMGRNAGWLTAASVLAGEKGFGPDLVYVPELDFDIESFTRAVKRVYDEKKKCIVAVSEGIHDAQGRLIASYASGDLTVDAFGHSEMGGTASYLARHMKRLTGAKVRAVEISLLQRCAAHCASKVDIEESCAAGRAAVEYAVSGVTDKMVGFARSADENGGYRCDICLLDLATVANAEKKLPREWINEEGNGILRPFVEYCLPLIQGRSDLCWEDGLPRFVRLKKIKAQP